MVGVVLRMISAILGFITGGAASLIGLLLALLPTVDISALPIAIPGEVSSILGMINVFIPVVDLIAIITWWALLILLLNVFIIVRSVVSNVTK